FAGGALGYELFTGRQPPESPQGPGPELTGPLGDLVRVAMAADRRERFGDLQQLLDAVEVVQPRRPSGDERALLGALHARASRWGKPQADESALRETLKVAQAAVEALSKRMSQLEADLKSQRSESGAALQRMGVAVAEMEKSRKQAERERDEAEDRATLAAIQKKPSMAPVLFLSAVIASALTGAAIIFGLYQLRPELFSPIPPPPQYTQQRPEAGRTGPETAQAPVDPSKADPSKAEPANPADLAAKADPTKPADAQGKVADPTLPLDAPGAPPGATTGAPAGAARTDAAHAALPEAPKADLAHPDAKNAAAPPLVAIQAPSSTTLAAPARPALPPPDAQALPLAPLVPADKAVKPNKASGAVSPGRMALSVARSHVVRGDKALERGNMEDALAAYDAALANSPELPDAIRGKGTVYASQGKDKEALA
ncbi:MAG: hypothetical protein JST92_16175, partial [Deltaproteobacteria bacterium]|nr:hypothetical protein [Deltaproteobacteria bacterium]